MDAAVETDVVFDATQKITVDNNIYIVEEMAPQNFLLESDLSKTQHIQFIPYEIVTEGSDTADLVDNVQLVMHVHSMLNGCILTEVDSQKEGISPEIFIETEGTVEVPQQEVFVPEVVKEPKEKLVYKCSECGRHLVSKRNLNYHLKHHTGELKHKCYICNKGFTHGNKLAIHMKLHSGQKDFVCLLCNRGFVQKCDLLRHTKLHTGQKDFICEICNKGFIQKSDLSKHSKMHTGQKDFICAVCGRAFAQKSDLTRHNKIHCID